MEEQMVSLPVGNLDETGDVPFFQALKEGSVGLPAPEEEGRLSVDVAETEEELVITAPMAGSLPENIELHLHNDLLTIRGERLSPMPPHARHFHQECYWGKFSRTVVLPVDVKAEMAQAEYRHGVLTIRLPKTMVSGNIPIMIMEE